MMTLRLAFGSLGLCAAVAAAGCSSGEPSEDVATGASGLNTGCAEETLKGIDVSRHNNDVDWAKVKASGQSFAFARVSDGITHVDGKFPDNWPAMKRVGIVRGAYQFFRPRRDPIEQADLMLQKIEEAGGLQAGDFPPVLDLEVVDGQSASVVVTKAKAWLARVESKVGMKPIVYTGNHMASTIGTNFAAYPLWIAHYTTACPRVPAGWDTWQFWQNSDKGRVPGVSGDVDTNFFQGGTSELSQLTLPAPAELGPFPKTIQPDVDDDGTDGARMGDGIRGFIE